MTVTPSLTSTDRRSARLGQRPRCFFGGAPLPQPVPSTPAPPEVPPVETPPEVNDPPVPHEHEPVRDPPPMEREGQHLH
jgi:hypothetical protein